MYFMMLQADRVVRPYKGVRVDGRTESSAQFVRLYLISLPVNSWRKLVAEPSLFSGL